MITFQELINSRGDDFINLLFTMPVTVYEKLDASQFSFEKDENDYWKSKYNYSCFKSWLYPENWSKKSEKDKWRSIFRIITISPNYGNPHLKTAGFPLFSHLWRKTSASARARRTNLLA
jgi:hypothetical protein